MNKNNIIEEFGTEVEEHDDIFSSDQASPTMEISTLNIETGERSTTAKNKKSKKKKAALETGTESRFTQFTEFGQGYTISGRTHKTLESGVYTIEFFEGM